MENDSILPYKIVEVSPNSKPSTKEKYDEFTEELMSSRFDSKLWLDSFNKTTEPGHPDPTLIRHEWRYFTDVTPQTEESPNSLTLRSPIDYRFVYPTFSQCPLLSERANLP
jgi:hypothetical protein